MKIKHLVKPEGPQRFWILFRQIIVIMHILIEFNFPDLKNRFKLFLK